MFELPSSSSGRTTHSTNYKPISSSLSKYSPPSISSPEQISLKQKVNKIALLNLKDHDLNICACEECIYSRQLNRKHRIELELSKNSSYRHQFDHKGRMVRGQDFKINYDTIQNRRNKSQVIDFSNYDKDYKNSRYQKPQKMHPEDELKFIGPSKERSAYAQQYPAFKNNANPYVKPIEVSVPNILKMNLKSVYQSNFNGVTKPPAESGKIADNLHGGMLWTGNSTYKQLFQQPQKPTQIRDSSSRMSKMSQDLNFKHQYQTTYRNQYLVNHKFCNRGEQNNGKNPLLQSLSMTIDI